MLKAVSGELSVLIFDYEAYSAPAYQISAKSDDPRLTDNDLTMSILGSVRHLGFDRK